MNLNFKFNHHHSLSQSVTHVMCHASLCLGGSCLLKCLLFRFPVPSIYLWTAVYGIHWCDFFFAFSFSISIFKIFTAYILRMSFNCCINWLQINVFFYNLCKIVLPFCCCFNLHFDWVELTACQLDYSIGVPFGSRK